MNKYKQIKSLISKSKKQDMLINISEYDLYHKIENMSDYISVLSFGFGRLNIRQQSIFNIRRSIFYNSIRIRKLKEL